MTIVVVCGNEQGDGDMGTVGWVDRRERILGPGNEFFQLLCVRSSWGVVIPGSGWDLPGCGGAWVLTGDIAVIAEWGSEMGARQVAWGIWGDSKLLASRRVSDSMGVSLAANSEGRVHFRTKDPEMVMESGRRLEEAEGGRVGGEEVGAGWYRLRIGARM
ncbi:MAG: hypothetical protein N2595_08155 [bacterium]|nr:hypothetical protein [bacterium]